MTLTNPYAITAVTAAFSQLLKRVLEEPTLSGADVTNERPSEATEAGRRLNVFLFQVAPNPALRNADLPFRDAGGRVVSQPVLALNLNYLVTAFGKSDSEMDAQHLLAHAMSIVHDTSVLTRAQIRSAITAYQTMPELANSDLADQIEPVKLTPLPMTQEDIFRLWSTFQAPYRLSVGYEASLVMVARRKPARPAMPVRAPHVDVIGPRLPTISDVSPQLLTVGQTLTIEGHQLAAPTTKVRFAAGDSDPVTVSDERVTVVPPAGLRIGAQPVQVVHSIAYGEPPPGGGEPAARTATVSNVAAWQRAPQISSAPGFVTRGNPVNIGVTPAVGRTQEAALVLDDRSIPIPPRPLAQETTNTLTFPVPADFPLGPGNAARSYLMRLTIDGVDSPYTVDPASGAYSGPRLEVRP
jgi:hypothetical protein